MLKGCETCEYNGWMPDDSREPWGPCDWCDDYSNYEKSHEVEVYMIRCTALKGCGKCVAEMDGQESRGGTVVCDIAEDLEFCKDDIIALCEFAVEDKN